MDHYDSRFPVRHGSTGARIGNCPARLRETFEGLILAGVEDVEWFDFGGSGCAHDLDASIANCGSESKAGWTIDGNRHTESARELTVAAGNI